MKKSFFFGSTVLSIIIIVSFFTNNFSLIVTVGGTVGIASIILAGLTAGAFQQRNVPAENFPLEDKSIRNFKSKWSINILLFGMPMLISAILTYILL